MSKPKLFYNVFFNDIAISKIIIYELIHLGSRIASFLVTLEQLLQENRSFPLINTSESEKCWFITFIML